MKAVRRQCMASVLTAVLILAVCGCSAKETAVEESLSERMMEETDPEEKKLSAESLEEEMQPADPAEDEMPFRVQWAEDMDFPEDCDIYDISASEPKSYIVFTTDSFLDKFSILEFTLTDVSESGDMEFEAGLALPQVSGLAADSPLAVGLTFAGDIPGYGFQYEDENGELRCFVMEISGEDGSILIREAERKNDKFVLKGGTEPCQRSAPVPGAGDDAGYFVIECPDWEVSYVADGIFDTLTASPVKLTEISKDTSDCLFAEDWSAETGIPLPGDLNGEGYSDDAYYYYADNSAEYGRLAVEVSEMGTYNFVGTYDFSYYLNTPAPGNDYTTLEIPYAQIFDGVLYAEIAHRTYSEDQPYTGFMVAVEVETGKLLWRSEMLVANGRNFVVGEDTIICGYGFTAEDDYLYILSRYSGAVLEKRKLKTGPDYFIPVDDSIYVLTYDTVYQYQIG